MRFVLCDYCRLCVIAGNISPIDVITHLPILCEEAGVPYVYVPSKEVSQCSFLILISYQSICFVVLRLYIFNEIQDLAQAGATKRPTCCVLVMLKPAKGDLTAEELEKLKTDYEQVSDDIKELATSVI